MSVTSAITLEHRHRAATVFGITLITLAVCSLALVIGAPGDTMEVRVGAGFTFLASVITVTLMLIFALIAKGDRCGDPKVAREPNSGL